MTDASETRIKPFFETEKLKVYNADFLKMRGVIEENSIDLIVTSPPFNIGMDYRSYNDNRPFDEYFEFTQKWMELCYDLSKPDGRMCVNIPFDILEIERRRHISAEYYFIARAVGWKYYKTIVWYKQIVPRHRKPVRGSWESASAPHIISTSDAIQIFYKERWKKDRKGSSDITKEEFIEWTENVWSFPGEWRDLNHPCPFPIELPLRCIKLFSYVDDVVLDPFLGTGTTLVACAITGRHGIGVEIDEEYCKIAEKRIKDVLYQKTLDIWIK